MGGGSQITGDAWCAGQAMWPSDPPLNTHPQHAAVSLVGELKEEWAKAILFAAICSIPAGKQRTQRTENRVATWWADADYCGTTARIL